MRITKAWLNEVLCYYSITSKQLQVLKQPIQKARGWMDNIIGMNIDAKTKQAFLDARSDKAFIKAGITPPIKSNNVSWKKNAYSIPLPEVSDKLKFIMAFQKQYVLDDAISLFLKCIDLNPELEKELNDIVLRLYDVKSGKFDFDSSGVETL